MKKQLLLTDYDGYIKKAACGTRIVIDELSAYCFFDCQDKKDKTSYGINDEVTNDYLFLDLETFYNLIARITCKQASNADVLEEVNAMFEKAGSEPKNYGLYDFD